jgi:hypothetical protein
MGVDFTVLKGYGILFPIEALSEEQRGSIYEVLNEAGVLFASQDDYGNCGQDFTAYGFVSIASNVNTIFDGKIGFTPTSLMLYGVYQENEYIRGGAIRPFAVNCIDDADDLSDEETDIKNKLLEAIAEKDEELADTIKKGGTFGDWLFSYFS